MWIFSGSSSSTSNVVMTPHFVEPMRKSCGLHAKFARFSVTRETSLKTLKTQRNTLKKTTAWKCPIFSSAAANMSWNEWMENLDFIQTSFIYFPLCKSSKCQEKLVVRFCVFVINCLIRTSWCKFSHFLRFKKSEVTVTFSDQDAKQKSLLCIQTWLFL